MRWCTQPHRALLRGRTALGHAPNPSTTARPFLASTKSSSSSSRGARSLVTLAIETSCDDTAVAVLDVSRDSRSARLLFNEAATSDNRRYRGIQPATTVIGHAHNLAPMLRRAVAAIPATDGDGRARTLGRPDVVAVTRGPGILQALATGLNTAKGLAVAWGVPLVGVHHMQAHVLTPRLVSALGMPMRSAPATVTRSDDGPAEPDVSGPEPSFPFLSVLASGGHTQFVFSAGMADHRIVVDTVDTAVGNVLDQTARVILPPDVLAASPDVMYARQLEAFAFPNGDEDHAFFRPSATRRAEAVDEPSAYGWAVPLPFRESRRLAYSFSSIYTQVHRIAESRPHMDVEERRELARHTMAAAFRHLVGRLCLALEDEDRPAKGSRKDAASTAAAEQQQPHGRPLMRTAKTLVVAGGVASNRFLMHVLRTTLDARGLGHISVVAPPLALCTDNAAMIAWAGTELYRAGWHTDLSVLPISKWPLGEGDGEGFLGTEGFLRRG